MSEDDEWTGGWVAEKIKTHNAVQSVEVISHHAIRVVRKNGTTVVVGTIARERVTKDTIQPLLDAHPGMCFIVNVPKTGVFDGSSLRYAKGRNAGLGALGDLLRALGMTNVAAHVNPKTQWVEQGLTQHSRVTSFERLDDNRYLIRRRDRADVTVVFLNEYEMSAAAVRSAIANYSLFNAIVKTNPNGSVSDQAHDAAKAAGRRIISKWGEFLGELNREWT